MFVFLLFIVGMFLLFDIRHHHHHNKTTGRPSPLLSAPRQFNGLFLVCLEQEFGIGGQQLLTCGTISLFGLQLLIVHLRCDAGDMMQSSKTVGQEHAATIAPWGHTDNAPSLTLTLNPTHLQVVKLFRKTFEFAQHAGFGPQ
jgi:hypothetical protein